MSGQTLEKEHCATAQGTHSSHTAFLCPVCAEGPECLNSGRKLRPRQRGLLRVGRGRGHPGVGSRPCRAHSPGAQTARGSRGPPPAPEPLLWSLSKRQLRLCRTLQCPALLPGLCPQARTVRARGRQSDWIPSRVRWQGAGRPQTAEPSSSCVPAASGEAPLFLSGAGATGRGCLCPAVLGTRTQNQGLGRSQPPRDCGADHSSPVPLSWERGPLCPVQDFWLSRGWGPPWPHLGFSGGTDHPGPI